jgi:RluA family pseudouridine synthase
MNEPFKVVFDDEYIIVVDKIAKVLIQPSPKKEKVTLTSLIIKKLNQKVFPCHRLDRETTGLIIYAKSPKIQEEITQQFRKGEVQKKYIAFVRGRLKKKQGLLQDYIIDREGKIFGEKPKKAETIYKVLKAGQDFSQVQLQPLTGRTNQLRIQLAKIDHPILGEAKYALRRNFKVRAKRLLLHAFYLSFIHPVSRERVILNIDLAPDMKKFSKQL